MALQTANARLADQVPEDNCAVVRSGHEEVSLLVERQSADRLLVSLQFHYRLEGADRTTFHFALLHVPDANIAVGVPNGKDILLRTAAYSAHLRRSVL